MKSGDLRQPYSGTTRRSFMKSASAGTAALAYSMAFGNSVPFRKALAAQPNVLFIICDDLNDSIEGMGGHSQAQTPNIDRLMARGVQFCNAHCNAPICGPSRASLWTGLYPSTTGYYGYAQQSNKWRNFPAMQNAVTLMEHFGANGYDVYGTGKIFHNGHEDNSVWKSPDGKGIKASFGPDAWDGSKETSHSNEPTYFKDRWTSFAPLSDVPSTAQYTGWMLDGQPFNYVDENNRDKMPDELSTDWAVARLNENHINPFFLSVGMNRPHGPMYAPKKYFDMFPLDSIVLPPYLANDLDDIPTILWPNQPDNPRPTKDDLTTLLDAGGEPLWKKWLQAYLACAAFVDDQIGKILDALDASAYANNTIIILTSDHGYHMGEKNHLKKTTVWEEVTRVPLVIAGPGITGDAIQSHNPVSLIDLYPTLIDLCGLPLNPNQGGNNISLDGHSLRPFLEDPANGSWGGPSVALSCLHGADVLAVNEPGDVARQHFTVRSNRYRYTLANTWEEELYDHEADPNEWTNLAGDAHYDSLKAPLKNELLLLTGQTSSIQERPLAPRNHNSPSIELTPHFLKHMTTITLKTGNVKIYNNEVKIVDMHGKVVEILRVKQNKNGLTRVDWNTTQKPNGIYTIKARIGRTLITQKAAVLK